MSIIAQQPGRTVYYMLKRKEVFNHDKFYGDKKIENKDSGGEHLAYVASRRLHEKKLSASYDDHLIFASGLAWVPVHLHAGAFGIFGGRCVTRVLFSKNVFVPEICFFRFAVTDYMCLIQDAFPGIFF